MASIGQGSRQANGRQIVTTDDDLEPPPIDRQMLAAARALWAEFDYLLPAPPDTVARIALDAANNPEHWGA